MDRPGLLPVLCQQGEAECKSIYKRDRRFVRYEKCPYVKSIQISVWPRQILEAYQTQPQMKEMMKNVDFYVTPVLNIDGYTYTWENSTVSAHA